MSYQRGRNSGWTGTVDLPQFGAKFEVRIYAASAAIESGVKVRLGRGSSNWPDTRPTSNDGRLILRGKERLDGFPLPETWKGATGSVTRTVHTGVTKTYPIQVISATSSADEKTADTDDFTLVCAITGNPTLTGYAGTQPTVDDPEASDRELYQGTAKVYDPSGLVTQATRTTDVWGDLADTDAGELARLASTIAAANAPMDGLKLRYAQFARDSIDGGQVVETWGLTNTEDDVEMPATIATPDAAQLIDAATITRVTDSQTLPDTPTAPITGTKLRSTSSVQLNDGKWRHTWSYARRTTEDDVEMDGSSVTDDLSDLSGSATITRVSTSSTPSPAPPASPLAEMKHVQTTTRQLHDGKWAHTYQYGPRSSEDAVEMDGSAETDDPADLIDAATITRVTDSATPPTTPDAPVSGTKVRSIQSRQLKDGKWAHTWGYGRRNTEDDVEMDGSNRIDDASSLQSRYEITVVETDSTPDGISAPSGLVLWGHRKKQLHDSAWAITYVYAELTSEQAITFPGTVTRDETSDIADEATITQVTDSSTAPSTPDAPVGQILSIESEQLTDSGKWRHTWRYGNTTALQRVQFPTDTIEDDPSDLTETDAQSQTSATSTLPTAPSTRVTGLVLRRTHSQRIAGTPELWLHRWFFGRRTTEQDITLPGTVTGDDPSDLLDRATVTLVNTSSTYPSSLDTPPTGLKLRGVESEQLTDAGKWRHTATYGRRNTEEDIEMPATETRLDETDLRTSATITQVTSSATPPTAPSSPSSDCKLTETRTRQIHASRWAHTFVFGPRTSEDEVEMDGTASTADAQALIAEGRTTIVSTSATPPSDPGAPDDTVLHSTITRPLKDGQYAHTFVYRPRNSEDDVEMPATQTTLDTSVLRGHAAIGEVLATSTIATPPTAPTGLKYVETEVRPLRSGKYLHVHRYAERTNEEGLEFEGTADDTDATQLTSGAEITQVTNSDTPASAPAAPVANTKHVRTTTRQLTDDRWKHTFVYRTRSSEDAIEFDGTIDQIDAGDIDDQGRATQVTTSSTAPSAPGAPGDAKLIETISQQIDDGHWRHTWRYGPRTSAEDIEYLQSRRTIEPTMIAPFALVKEITASATPDPTGLNPDTTNLAYHSTESHRLTDGKWVHAHLFRPFNPEEDIEAEGTIARSDPSGSFITHDTITSVDAFSSAVPPSVSGKSCVRAETVKIARGRWRHRFDYDVRGTHEQLEAGQAQAHTDPADLDDEQVTADVYLTASPPADPSAPTGLKLVRKTDLSTPHPDYTLRVYRWGKKTTADALELQNTWTEEDPDALASRASVARVDDDPSLPAGFVERATRTQALSQGLSTNHALKIVEGGLITRAQELEFNRSIATANPIRGSERIEASVVSHAGTAEALAGSLLSANQATASFIEAEVKRLTGEKALQALHYLDEDKTLIAGGCSAAQIMVRGVPATGLPFNVFTPGAVVVGDSQARVYIYFNGGDLRARPMSIWRARGSFRFRRVWTAGLTTMTSAADWQPYQFLAVRGRQNAAEFLGYSAGEVMYEGPVMMLTFAVAGTRRIVVDYQFQTDNWKFFDDAFLPEGPTDTSASITSSGIYNATLFEAGYVCGFPGTADFSGFVA